MIISKKINVESMTTKTLSTYNIKNKRSIMAISKAAKGIGRTQDGEEIIACTYANADKAVAAILKRL